MKGWKFNVASRLKQSDKFWIFEASHKNDEMLILQSLSTCLQNVSFVPLKIQTVLSSSPAGDVGLEVVNSVPEEFLEFDIKWKDWGADLRLALTKKWD